MVKTALFDLDGTLIDSLPLIKATYQRVFETMEIPWDDGRVMESIGLPLIRIAEQFAGNQADCFYKLYLKYQNENHGDYIKLFPGTFDALNKIKSKGYTIGIVTSKRRETAEEAIESTHIEPLISALIAFEDVKAHKPEPEPVLKAMNFLTAAPEKTVYVGDSWYDIMAGKSAGVATVGVTWGMADRLKLQEHKPNRIIDCWDELFHVIS